jgi:uncharacterized protein YbdZ (MbtH family)
MPYSGDQDSVVYKVIVNGEEQYSIWPSYKQIPHGWKYAGKTGMKGDCLSYIKEVWLDMRPLSLRKKMEDSDKKAPTAILDAIVPPRQNLADRLSNGEHRVEAALRPERNSKAFKEAIDRGYVHIRFTGTIGVTELGVTVDRDSSDFSMADFENGQGNAHIEGRLILDYAQVRCVADIDLNTWSGKAHLVKDERTGKD